MRDLKKESELKKMTAIQLPLNIFDLEPYFFSYFPCHLQTNKKPTTDFQQIQEKKPNPKIKFVLIRLTEFLYGKFPVTRTKTRSMKTHF